MTSVAGSNVVGFATWTSTPLGNAVEDADIDMVQKYLNDGHNPAAGDDEAIQAAAENGFLNILKLLLSDKRVNPASGDNYAIEHACYFGHCDVVKVLMADKRVYPVPCAFAAAVRHGFFDVVKQLLTDNRVDPAADDNKAIDEAVENNYVDIVHLLLTYEQVWKKPFSFFVYNGISRISGLCVTKTRFALDIIKKFSSQNMFDGCDDVCIKIATMAYGNEMITIGNRRTTSDVETMLTKIGNLNC